MKIYLLFQHFGTVKHKLFVGRKLYITPIQLIQKSMNSSGVYYVLWNDVNISTEEQKKIVSFLQFYFTVVYGYRNISLSLFCHEIAYYHRTR